MKKLGAFTGQRVLTLLEGSILLFQHVNYADQIIKALLQCLELNFKLVFW